MPVTDYADKENRVIRINKDVVNSGISLGSKNPYIADSLFSFVLLKTMADYTNNGN
jgi:hypothetical protein